MKEKDKVLQALCDGLGENYKLMEIDLERCIYRNFGNRFEVEVSGVHTAKQNKKATIYLWCMDATGAHGYVIKKVGEVPRNRIGKMVEELYEYSENLISQGYDCYEKVQAYLKELVKKEQMMSLVDENDLAEFLDETEDSKTEEEQKVVIPETTTETTPAVEKETEETTQKNTGGADIWKLCTIVLAGGLGIGAVVVYLKYGRKKEEGFVSEQLEFTDGPFINEEQENEDGQED